MNLFLQSIADVLEVDELSLDTPFRETPDWSSLKGFGLLVTMENDWQAPLTVDRFLELATVRDLYREAFAAFAANLLNVPRTSLSGSTGMGDLVEWDSVNHLRLVMEAEKRFGSSYPLERIPQIRTVDDFLVD